MLTGADVGNITLIRCARSTARARSSSSFVLNTTGSTAVARVHAAQPSHATCRDSANIGVATLAGLLAPHGASRRRTHVGAKYSHCNGCGTFVREPLGGQWPACAMAPEGSPRAFTTLAMTCADAQVRRTCGRGRNFPWASINAMTLPAMSTLANAAQSGCRSAAAAGAAVVLHNGDRPWRSASQVRDWWRRRGGAGAVPAAAAARGA